MPGCCGAISVERECNCDKGLPCDCNTCACAPNCNKCLTQKIGLLQHFIRVPLESNILDFSLPPMAQPSCPSCSIPPTAIIISGIVSAGVIAGILGIMNKKKK